MDRVSKPINYESIELPSTGGGGGFGKTLSFCDTLPPSFQGKELSAF